MKKNNREDEIINETIKLRHALLTMLKYDIYKMYNKCAVENRVSDFEYNMIMNLYDEYVSLRSIELKNKFRCEEDIDFLLEEVSNIYFN